MVGRKRTATRASSRRNNEGSSNNGSDIYEEMLADAGVEVQNDSPERPMKRRKPGSGRGNRLFDESIALSDAGVLDNERRQDAEAETGADTDSDAAEEEDKDIEFQDVVLPAPTLQTMDLASDENSDDGDEDISFENIDIDTSPNVPDSASQVPQILQLNLTVQKASSASSKRPADRRKPISKEEKERRIDIHKMHILCILSHVARRNHWCNDPKVHDILLPHLTNKAINYLNPGTHLSQFGQTESLKNGLQQAEDMWKTKFEITERGLRRALWAEDVEQLKDVGHSP